MAIYDFLTPLDGTRVPRENFSGLRSLFANFITLNEPLQEKKIPPLPFKIVLNARICVYLFVRSYNIYLFIYLF